MSEDRLFSFANRWFITSVGITVAMFLLSVLMGFVLLPYAEPDSRFGSLWDQICSAAGFPVRHSVTETVSPAFIVSTATPDTAAIREPSASSIGSGATLAQKCAICHGPTGISRADSPNLAAQHAAAIYKELQDFKSGARVNSTMSPFAVAMSGQDMRDLAAYYAYLPRLPEERPSGSVPAPAIVVSGAPMRGIAPCGACHGDIESKWGAPRIGGQPPAYIKAQLEAFASGSRHNDTSQQMRNVARAMTPDEIDAAAHYYASLH